MKALEYAKSSGALCVGITNTVGSAIARNTQCGIHINAGAEIGVASTKAYTSQIVAITMMALVLSEDAISKQRRRDEIIDSLLNLPDAIRQSLELNEMVQKLAGDLKDEQSLLVFGRGRNYATAMEAALKVKEVSYMHSEGINAGEMKHGPLALVDEHMPIIVIATMDEMHNKMLYGVIQQLMARNARLIVICNEEDQDAKDMIGDKYPLIPVPHLDDAVQPVINIVPLQLLSYHLTLLRGYNVDQPRNLAKSVTVTEE
jgi:glucosamine--fructose-6-phosphate aminotransferase (isomerizing)